MVSWGSLSGLWLVESVGQACPSLGATATKFSEVVGSSSKLEKMLDQN